MAIEPNRALVEYCQELEQENQALCEGLQALRESNQFMKEIKSELLADLQRVVDESNSDELGALLPVAIKWGLIDTESVEKEKLLSSMSTVVAMPPSSLIQ